MYYKKLFSIVILFLTIFSINASKVNAANVTGYAWSSNIGWVKFDTGSSLPVTIATSSGIGTFSGYAWSSNIGWISFNSVTGCPVMPANGTCIGKADLNTGAITGWARACAGTINNDCNSAKRTDGWDGWIELSGSNHSSPSTTGSGGVTLSTTTGSINGYAFGDMVGWLSFNVSCPACVGQAVVPPPTISVDLKVNNSDGLVTINDNTSVTVSWTLTGDPDSCLLKKNVAGIVSQIGSPYIANGSVSSGNLTYAANNPTIYFMTCTKSGSTDVTDSVTVNITNPTPPVAPGGGGSADIGKLWFVNLDSSTTTTKQVRLNIKTNVAWSLPGGWTGCSVSPNSADQLVAGWNDIIFPVSSLATLKNNKAGDYILSIKCGAASSTKSISIKVTDPDAGNR